MSVRGERCGMLALSYCVFPLENVIVAAISRDDEELKFLQAKWIGHYYNSVGRARARRVVPLVKKIPYDFIVDVHNLIGAFPHISISV